MYGDVSSLYHTLVVNLVSLSYYMLLQMFLIGTVVVLTFRWSLPLHVLYTFSFIGRVMALTSRQSLPSNVHKKCSCAGTVAALEALTCRIISHFTVGANETER